MRPKDSVRVAHMLAAIAKIAGWIEGVGRDAFETDQQLQAAVAYQIQIIGEATYHLSDEFKTTAPEIPWHKIEGMRHRLVHDYFEIDVQVVWEVATARLPDLARQLLPFAPAEEE